MRDMPRDKHVCAIEAGGQHQVLSLIFEIGSLSEFGAH